MEGAQNVTPTLNMEKVGVYQGGKTQQRFSSMRMM
jgi:hypothetical protein